MQKTNSMSKCKGCNKDKEIVNKFHYLCIECNNIRLHGSKYGKQYKNTLNKITPLKTGKKKKAKKSIFYKAPDADIKKETKLDKDERFYEEAFEACDAHVCEECKAPLPDYFRSDDGRIVARFRYSHIIPKSIAPELRHEIKNINHLCLEHHTQWDFGDKESMKIYKENKKRFPHHFS